MVTFQAKFRLMLLELSAQDMGRHTMLLPQCQPHKYIQAVSQGCDFALNSNPCLLSRLRRSRKDQGRGVYAEKTLQEVGLHKAHCLWVCFLSWAGCSGLFGTAISWAPNQQPW